MKNVSKEMNNSLGNKMERFLMLPKGAVGSSYKLQSIGNRELSVEGCKGVLQYEHEEIRLNVGNGQIRILGRNLCIPVLERNFVQIEGYILQIEFL